MIFQEDEVSDAKRATWEKINTLVKNGEFIKHRWEFVNKLFNMYQTENGDLIEYIDIVI